VTNLESFNNVAGWIDYIKENRGDDVLIFIIGNKIDMIEDRAVSTEEAQDKFKTIGALFIEVSAKTGGNL